MSWWEAGILAAILAPTGAGLGLVIVHGARVPRRIRQALNVEAGLNDGLSVPFLMFFIALAVTALHGTAGTGGLLRYLGEQLGYGTLIGLAIGLAGGWLLGLARRAPPRRPMDRAPPRARRTGTPAASPTTRRACRPRPTPRASDPRARPALPTRAAR